MSRRGVGASAGWITALLFAVGCHQGTNATGAGATDAGAGAATSSTARLTFARDGRTVRALTLDEMTRLAPPETLHGIDPYYQHEKHFRALPIEPLLAAGFAGEDAGALAQQQFLLRAADGYTVPIAGERLLEGGAYLAVADLDVPGWEPIGPRRVTPGPFYLVWKYPPQQDLESHPRPYELVTVEIASFESVFPHTAPTGVAEGEPARRGYAVFRQLCVRCHAINREGGRVGPDLNVPQSIMEYRPEAQIRQYIRDPLTFRYGTMPAHPQLTDADLDGLIAYFRAMSTRKHDPERAQATDAGAGAPPPGDAAP